MEFTDINILFSFILFMWNCRGLVIFFLIDSIPNFKLSLPPEVLF